MSRLPAIPRAIPEHLDELTAEWLTQTLRECGVLRSARVREARAEVLGEGEGFVGQIVRLHLELDAAEAGVPATLIAKLPTQLAQNRALGELLGAYEREIRFYTELAGEVRLRTPRCYYAAMDPNPLAGREEAVLRFVERVPTWALRLLVPLSMRVSRRSRRRYVLLLEDLAPARTGDQVAGCTPAEAAHILRALAVAHAGLWNASRLDSLFWLTRIDLFAGITRILFLRNRRAFFERLGDGLPDSIAGVAAWLEANDMALMRHLGSPPLTLMHGDYRLDNLFFSGPADEPTVTAIDWQGVGRSRPAFDVAYFITSNLDADAAREAETGLVGAYHEELLSRGADGYAFEECWRDYQLSKLFLLYRTIMGIDMIDLSHERGEALLDRTLEGIFALLPTDDLDGLLHR